MGKPKTSLSTLLVGIASAALLFAVGDCHNRKESSTTTNYDGPTKTGNAAIETHGVDTTSNKNYPDPASPISTQYPILIAAKATGEEMWQKMSNNAALAPFTITGGNWDVGNIDKNGIDGLDIDAVFHNKDIDISDASDRWWNVDWTAPNPGDSLPQAQYCYDNYYNRWNGALIVMSPLDPFLTLGDPATGSTADCADITYAGWHKVHQGWDKHNDTILNHIFWYNTTSPNDVTIMTEIMKMKTGNQEYIPAPNSHSPSFPTSNDIGLALLGTQAGQGATAFLTKYQNAGALGWKVIDSVKFFSSNKDNQYQYSFHFMVKTITDAMHVRA